MELTDLQYFKAVAEERHFGRAARRFHFTTSNLSQHIRRLEREFGVRLFDRQPGTVVLTAVGEVVLAHAERVIAEAEELKAAVALARRGQSAVITVSYCAESGQYLASTIRSFADRFPGTEIRMRTRTSGEVIQEILLGQASVGVTRSVSDELSSLVLFERSYDHVAVAADSPLATRAALTAADLDGQHMLVPQGNASEVIEKLDATFRPLGITVFHDVHPIRTYHDCFDLIAAGYGIELVSKDVVVGSHRNDVVMLPVRDVCLTFCENLVWCHDASPLVKAFVTFIKDAVGARTWS